MPAFVLIKGKIANINGKENIYLPAYAIITANNIEEIRNIENGTYPLNNEDELMIIQQAIQNNQ